MGLRASRWGQETGGGACKPCWEGAPEQGSLCAKVGSMVLWSQGKEDAFAGFTAGQGYSGIMNETLLDYRT